MAIKLTAPLSNVPESTVFWNWVEVPSPCFKSIPKWQKKDGMAYSVNASLSWWQGQNKMVKAWLACSRLRDSGGKSFSNKKCEKRAGAGERQGGSLPFFAPPPPPFPSRARLNFTFNKFPLHILSESLAQAKAWLKWPCWIVSPRPYRV